MEFGYYQPTRIVWGNGKIKETGEYVAQLGKRLLVVTMPFPSPTEKGFHAIVESCEKAGAKVVHFDGVVPNPTLESVEKGVALAKEQRVDVVLGYGGGSSMDTAKAIAVGATHEGSPWDYLFFKKEPTAATLPIVAITTTSGTGSQVTQVSVMTETKTHTKSAIFHENIYPKVAIVDPDLMETLPPRVTAATGFDAFAHAFEAYIHKGTNPYIETLALKTIELVGDNLFDAVKIGGKEARANMALADTLAGLCIAGAGVTLPHGIGMMISGFCPHVAHGESLALTYPEFVRFTAASAPEKFGKMAKLIGRSLEPDVENLSDVDAAERTGPIIDQFLKEIALWKGFQDFDITDEALREIADHCHDLPDYQNNPRIASIDQIYDILRRSRKRT